jgi:hypothetical protein
VRILLITHGRSGSTSLQSALSELLGMSMIVEPFNTAYWEIDLNKPPPAMDVLDDDIIVKTMINDNNSWIIDNYKEFDKVIFLFRDNVRDTMISSQNAHVYGYKNTYRDTEEVHTGTIEYMLKRYSDLYRLFDTLENLSDSVTMLWYGDIYTNIDKCKKTLSSIGIDFDDVSFVKVYEKYFHEKNRLRQVD